MLFDAAGTLIETARPVGEVYSKCAREHGVAISAARLDDAFRRILTQAPPMLFADAPDDRIPELEASWWRGLVRSTFLAADGTARFRDFNQFFADLYAHYSGPGAWRARPGAQEALAVRGDGVLRRRVVPVEVHDEIDPLRLGHREERRHEDEDRRVGVGAASVGVGRILGTKRARRSDPSRRGFGPACEERKRPRTPQGHERPAKHRLRP